MSVAQVQVSASAIRYNLAALGKLLPPDVEVAAVVKGNAYGHGLEQVTPVLEPMVDAFQVDDLDELRALRKLTQKRALVFGYVPSEDLEEALALDGEIAVYDAERLEALAKVAQKGQGGKVHLKVDALLGRLGVAPSELPAFLDALRHAKGIEVVSCYAHYANIEDTEDPTHALRQETVFEACYQQVRQAFPRVKRHLSATSGLMARERTGVLNDMVRLGIGLYGLYPSGPLAKSFAQLGLRPVMRWVTEVAQVKRLSKGHPVGYGLTCVLDKDSIIGIVPQGYSDGYDRGLSGCGEVLVRGIRRPVLGRVAMNMFAIDLSAAPGAQQGDEAVLLGEQGEDRITAEEIAEKLGTINYEVVARVSPLLPRVVD